MSDDLLGAIQSRIGDLSRQEAAVAALVLRDPGQILRMPLNTLAERAGVSQPTVIRFCRSMDCAGVRDFKLRLAQSLARGTPYVHAFVEAGDSAADYAAKIVDATIAAVTDMRNRIDPAAIDRAVERLSGARQIVFFGMGGSGSVAQDAMHKFMRLDQPAFAHTDPLVARMAVAAMRPGDVLVLISNTGRTRAVVEVAAQARDHGVTVLALAAPGSPLAAKVDIALAIEPAEDTEVYTPMASRIVHLVLIDVLATGVALRKGPGVQEHLKRVKRSLLPSRLPKDE